MYGGSRKEEAAKTLLKLTVKGLDEPVFTDIDRTKWIFRKRAWCGRFFDIHDIAEGDYIAITKLDELHYLIERWFRNCYP